MAFDPRDPSFFDPAAAAAELARVTVICDGCRRCHRLCPTFDVLLESVDADREQFGVIPSAQFSHAVPEEWNH